MASLTPVVDDQPHLDEFIDKIKFLRKNKINAVVRFVATKSRIPLIDPMYSLLKKNKIPFIVYPEFKYELGVVTESYTADEADVIYRHANCIGKMNLRNTGVRGRELNCSAGNRSLYIGPDGTIYPCVNFQQYCVLGNVFTGNVSSIEKISCGTVCTCDIHYFYEINGVPTSIDDTTEEYYKKWIQKNGLENKWWEKKW
jgi:MoaA/NifB/PqqE/SkfB family radical SAM enzyme